MRITSINATRHSKFASIKSYRRYIQYVLAIIEAGVNDTERHMCAAIILKYVYPKDARAPNAQVISNVRATSCERTEREIIMSELNCYPR